MDQIIITAEKYAGLLDQVKSAREYWNTIGHNRKYIDDNNKIVVPSTQFKWITKEYEDKLGKTLDLGCGVGRHFFYLIKRKVDIRGIDIAEEALKFAKKEGTRLGYLLDGKLIHGSMLELPYKDATFNTVLAWGVLHQIDTDGMLIALKEIYRILSEGGILYGHVRVDRITPEGKRHKKTATVTEDIRCGSTRVFYEPCDFIERVEKMGFESGRLRDNNLIPYCTVSKRHEDPFGDTEEGVRERLFFSFKKNPSMKTLDVIVDERPKK